MRVGTPLGGRKRGGNNCGRIQAERCDASKVVNAVNTQVEAKEENEAQGKDKLNVGQW